MHTFPAHTEWNILFFFFLGFGLYSRIRFRHRDVHHSDDTHPPDGRYARRGRGHARRPDRCAACAFRRKHVDYGAARWSFGATGMFSNLRFLFKNFLGGFYVCFINLVTGAHTGRAGMGSEIGVEGTGENCGRGSESKRSREEGTVTRRAQARQSS